MADRRVPKGRGKVKRKRGYRPEQAERDLIRKVAREVGRECALSVFSERAERALSLLREEQEEELRAQWANEGALLMLENLARAGALRYGFAEVVQQFVPAVRSGAGGMQTLAYGDVKLYPVEPLDLEG